MIKTRKVAGSLTLVLGDEAQASFAIAASWTDYFPDGQAAVCAPDQYISTEALIALCQLSKRVFE